jgi:hypothetical protein
MSGREADGETQRALAALRFGLAEEGWQEPDSIIVECRFNAVDAPSAAAAAAGLMALQPDAILANTNIVTEVRNGLDVVSVRLTFLDGSGRVTDLGHARLAIGPAS